MGLAGIVPGELVGVLDRAVTEQLIQPWFYAIGNQEVYVLDANGNNPTRLSEVLSVEWDPTWSPDGSRIAYSSDRGGNLQIYIMDNGGSNLRRLTTPGQGLPADLEAVSRQPDQQQRAWAPTGPQALLLHCRVRSRHSPSRGEGRGEGFSAG